MNYISNATKTTYHYVFHDLVDHRSDNWFLMSSPLPSLVILATYILFVKIGPLYMKGRPAYNLNKIILFYNFLQICCCGHIIKSAAVLTFRSNPRLFCEPVNYSNDPIAIQIAETCWQFYLLKIVDLLDTVFFILRKNFDKASIFHICHHVVLVINSWICVRFVPGGHGMLPGILTDFVRFWLYSYYFVSMIWPNLISARWWGRRYNLLLVIVSMIVIAHNVPVLFMECEYPLVPCVINLGIGSAFLYNFYKFYRQASTKAKAT